MTIRLTLPGATTKKTSPRVIPLISGEGLRQLVKDLSTSTSHRESIKIIMRGINLSVQPSENYVEWFDQLYLHRASIRESLVRAGLNPPIKERVSIAALIYREALRGDWTGYVDAIADAIQSDVWQCGSCRKKTTTLSNCPHCKGSIAGMRLSRKGLGVIEDDKQIDHWDGTRLLKDAARPRVELVITTARAMNQAAMEFEAEPLPALIPAAAPGDLEMKF